MRRKPSPAAERYRRRRWLRKHHPFPRAILDASWQATIDAIVASYMRIHGRGLFRVRKAVKGSVAPYMVDLTLPDGRVYIGELRKHVTDGTTWYEGILDARSLGAALRDEQLNADGALPESAPPKFNLWPRQIKINPAPVSQQGKASSDFLGTLWVSASDGAPGENCSPSLPAADS